MSTSRDAPVKDRLLAAAVTCLRRTGFDATTARDIAAEAQANLRSISYHYGSTRGLLVAAISLNWRSWLAPLIATASDVELEPSERLRRGIDAFHEALSDNGPMVRAWLEAVIVAHSDAELRQVLADNQAEFQRALARTLADAGQSDAERRAAAIVDVCDGAVVRFLLHGEAPPPHEIAHAASAALVGISP